jgi:RNA polymerase sigma factor (sigma-70 family)
VPTLLKRGKVYAEYERIVGPIAGSLIRVLPASIEVDDLIQEGKKALWKATAVYTNRRKDSFGFFVRLKIKGAMLDSIKGRNWREATHQELAPVLQITDRRATVEQQMIAGEEARTDFVAKQKQLGQVALAIADADPLYQPLNKKAKRVIELRYRRGKTQSAAGAAMGMTQQSVHQIEARTLKNLRRKVAA